MELGNRSACCADVVTGRGAALSGVNFDHRPVLDHAVYFAHLVILDRDAARRPVAAVWGSASTIGLPVDEDVTTGVSAKCGRLTTVVQIGV